MSDCLVIGGGVVGLSIAYELARRQLNVELIDRQAPGQEASWAGAGILPPVSEDPVSDPIDQLRALSHALHRDWARDLFSETGIDTGYRECGGIYLARSAGEAASLQGMARLFDEVGIPIQKLSPGQLADLEPAFAQLAKAETLKAAYLTPGESQLRNPRHLQALLAACRQRGVVVRANAQATGFKIGQGRIHEVHTSVGPLRADCYCMTAGAWTYQLLQDLDVQTSVFPVRGQIVMYRCPKELFSRVVNEGSRYLVPRDDGRVLVGSTEEEVGFDKSNTEEAVAELRELAETLIPGLRSAVVERVWAGLRPASFDGLPYLGRLPELDNAYVATGHFRSGLHLSTGTASLMAQLICSETPRVSLAPFQICRGAAFR